MKNGIILTGGHGSRLSPFTNITNKHLLNVNNKFVIDYPLKTLKNMGVQNLTVVLGGNHFEQIIKYLKDGEDWGFNINYCYQTSPKGIAHAINLCKRFVTDDSDFSVILGDNIFEDNIKWNNTNQGAQIVLADHSELNRFGVASLNELGQIKKIEEKPVELDADFTNLAIAGCYLFTPQYFEYFKELKPSTRGEFEITEIISMYLRDNNLSWTKLNNLWSDAGTHESIAFVNNYFYSKSNPK
jgi:glucose-1-phosphate thymidylyltransferase